MVGIVREEGRGRGERERQEGDGGESDGGETDRRERNIYETDSNHAGLGDFTVSTVRCKRAFRRGKMTIMAFPGPYV